MSILQWYVAPEDQGQIVECAYASDGYVPALYMRVTDRSVPCSAYYTAEADQLVGDWEPWNTAPELEGEWRGVGHVALEAERIAAERGVSLQLARSLAAVLLGGEPPARCEHKSIDAVSGQCAGCGSDLDDHAAAGGDLCVDGGDGCCAGCGVSLVECDDCGGRGYHRPGCEETP
jgi:hypothetical protein